MTYDELHLLLLAHRYYLRETVTHSFGQSTEVWTSHHGDLAVPRGASLSLGNYYAYLAAKVRA